MLYEYHFIQKETKEFHINYLGLYYNALLQNLLIDLLSWVTITLYFVSYFIQY